MGWQDDPVVDDKKPAWQADPVLDDSGSGIDALAQYHVQNNITPTEDLRSHTLSVEGKPLDLTPDEVQQYKDRSMFWNKLGAPDQNAATSAGRFLPTMKAQQVEDEANRRTAKAATIGPGVIGDVTRNVITGLGSAGTKLAALPVRLMDKEAGTEVSKQAQGYVRGAQDVNETEGTMPSWISNAVERVTEGLSTHYATAGLSPAVFAGEAAQDAEQNADEAGVTGGAKLLNVAGHAAIAAFTGKLLNKLGVGPNGDVPAATLKDALVRTIKEVPSFEAMAFASKFNDRFLGVDKSKWTVSDILHTARDAAVDAAGFGAAGYVGGKAQQGARGVSEMLPEEARQKPVTWALEKAGLPSDADTSETARFLQNPKNAEAAMKFVESSGNRAALLQVKNAIAAAGASGMGPDETMLGDIAPAGKAPTGLSPEEADQIINSVEHPTPLHIPDAEDQFGLEKINTYGLDQVHSYDKVDGGALTHVPGESDVPVNERDYQKQTSPNLDDLMADFEEHAKAKGLTDSGVAREAKNADVELTYPGGEKVIVKGIDTATAEIENAKRDTENNGSEARGAGLPKDVRSATGAGDAEAERGSAEPAAQAADAERGAAASDTQSGAGDQGLDEKAGVAPTALRKSFWKKATSTPKAAEVTPQESETPSKTVPEVKPKTEDKQVEAGLMAHLPKHLVEGAETLISEANKAVKGSSLPETSAKSEVAADAVAAHAAANGGAAGEWLGKRWKDAVIPKGASEADRKLIGAALVEQRLRFEKAKGNDLGTMVGKGKPFATAADFQAALKTSLVQNATKAVEASVQPEKTALFTKGEGYEAGDALPPEYAGRISLIRADGGDTGAPTKVTGLAKRVRSVFAKKASGQSEHETDIGKILDSMASESMKASTGKEMLDTLMKEGLASFKEAKDRDVIAVKYPERMTNKDGKAYIKTYEGPLYVDKAIAPEVRKAMGVEGKSPVPEWLQTIGKGVNAINTSGLALPLAIAGVSAESGGKLGTAYKILSAASPEFTTHVVKSVLTIATQNGGFKNAAMDLARTSGLNVFHALYGIGHAANDIAKSDPKVQAEMEKIANIGALRPNTEGLIGHIENASRLVMSRMYDNLVERGLREDTASGRREFINQLGQYTPGMQSDFVRVLKHLGVGPFAVAGTTGARVGTKSLLGISAGKSKAPITESGLQVTRNLVLSAATAGALRAIIWKDREDEMPRGGLFDVPLPWRDGKGKYYNMDFALTSMVGRGLRTTGIDAGLEGQHEGLPTGMVADKAITQAGNALTLPMMGPVPQAAAVLATGKDIGFGQGFRKAKTAKPGESQYAENWKAMLKQMDPSVANTMDALDEESAGKDTWGNKAVQAIGRPFGLRTKADK